MQTEVGERPRAASGGRRAAAAVALLLLGAAMTSVVVALARHPVELPVALLLLGVAVAAAWAALVRRGLPRLLAAVVSIAALAGIVLLPDLRSGVLLAVVIGLVLLSAAVARVALGHDLAPSTQGRRVGPAEHGVLLMNPWSGGGKVARCALEGKARSAGLTPIVLNPGDDLGALAEEAVADGADVLGMAGGDGSQALVADVARQHDVAFVCVPAGTRNHFALDLGLDRDDVAAALDAFGEAVERRVDLALLGDRVFVNNASLGVYATVVQSEAYRGAKLSTTAQLLPDLLGPDAEPVDLRFPRSGGSTATPPDILLVSNGAYRLDSLNGMGTRARLDAGVLGVVTVTLDRALDLPALIAAHLAGRISHFGGYNEWTTPALEITSGQPLVDAGVDGEALRLSPPLRFRSLPGALRVRTPVDAPGVAPAAVAPTGVGNATRALFRVLVKGSAR
jgi:diacylglycerol kinase family enzyme